MNKTIPRRLESPRSTTVVYDSATGDVVHYHHVVVLPRGKAPSEEKIEADALSFAAKFTQRDVASLKALRVESDDFLDGVAYKVNLNTTKLERVEGESPLNPYEQHRALLSNLQKRSD